jgi:hypothetical protein
MSLAAALNFAPPMNAARAARHIRRGLLDSERLEEPYRRWRIAEALPEEIAVGLICLPIAPPLIDDCGGVRDRHNMKRTFLTPSLQAEFPACALLAEALQRPEMARLMGETCGFEVEGSFLRIEYIQDLNGAWLEPHRDIPEKLCSMVVYLCTGPHAKDWGTDIYDHDRRWIGRSSAEFNSATIFTPGAHSWHGFDPRPITGVRRLLEINYVRPSWRDRDQLCFPEHPISVEEA